MSIRSHASSNLYGFHAPSNLYEQPNSIWFFTQDDLSEEMSSFVPVLVQHLLFHQFASGIIYSRHDVYKGDIKFVVGPKAVPVNSAGECSNVCIAIKNCHLFRYDRPNRTCSTYRDERTNNEIGKAKIFIRDRSDFAGR